MKKIAIMKFHEINAPDGQALNTAIIIRTDLKDKEIDTLITAIANIKEHADDGESISGFEVPDNWESRGWDEKIWDVAEYFAGYTGTFEIVEVSHVACIQVN